MFKSQSSKYILVAGGMHSSLVIFYIYILVCIIHAHRQQPLTPRIYFEEDEIIQPIQLNGESHVGTSSIPNSRPFNLTKSISYSGKLVNYTAYQDYLYFVQVCGAEGGQSKHAIGGKGGCIYSYFIWNTSTTWLVYVGGHANGSIGGFNGGGSGTKYGGGGGGSSDIRLNIDMHSRLVVGGGGGGGGNIYL